MYRLLIVDRDRDTCESLRFLLDWERYGVTGIRTARTAQEGLALAVDFRPHIAILADDLGDFSGFSLAAQLRSAGSPAVCCILSPRAELRAAQLAMDSGARGYLLKPLDRGALDAFIRRAIQWELHGTLPENPTPPDCDPILGVGYGGFSPITNKLLMLIKADYRRSLNLTAISASLGLSSKYMGRVFLKDTGMKFSDYLLQYRMLRAKKLIQDSPEKISVIAGMVGYSQINNFYVHFKRHFGYSPGDLRNFVTPAAGRQNINSLSTENTNK